MSPKLPVLSGDDLIGILEKFGYVTIRQRGSHDRLDLLEHSVRISIAPELDEGSRIGLSYAVHGARGRREGPRRGNRY